MDPVRIMATRLSSGKSFRPLAQWFRCANNLSAVSSLDGDHRCTYVTSACGEELRGHPEGHSPSDISIRQLFLRSGRLICGERVFHSSSSKSQLPLPGFQTHKRGPGRGFTTSAGNDSNEGEKETIHVTFVNRLGDEATIKVPLGMSMLEAAHVNDIDLEGACEGSLACSTCHVIVMDEDMYNKMPEPSDEENDMLDLAFGLTETSRLGCQVIAKKELDGMHLVLPSATRNFAVDGFVAKPH